MDNIVKYVDRDGKELETAPYEYKDNSVVIAIPGSGMSFNRKITQTFIETCIKSQEISKTVKASDTLEIECDEVQLIMIEFFDSSLRFEIRLVEENCIALEKQFISINEAISYFYEHANRDAEFISSMEKIVDTGESYRDILKMKDSLEETDDRGTIFIQPAFPEKSGKIEVK